MGDQCDFEGDDVKLERPICFLDLEGTSLDVTESRIVEMACVVISPDMSRREWCQRFNPGVPIPKDATDVHGITNEDVKDCPSFKEWAPRIVKGFDGKDIAGFNIRGYDLAVLDAELRRCGLRMPTDATFVDVFHLYQRLNPRDLSSAVMKYCGRTHEDAHGALPDTVATADVLLGMLANHTEIAEMSVADIDTFSLRDPEKRPADFSGKLYKGKDGFLRYNFGKAKDVRVADDPGFGMWMKRQFSPPFPADTLELLEAELDRQ